MTNIRRATSPALPFCTTILTHLSEGCKPALRPATGKLDPITEGLELRQHLSGRVFDGDHLKEPHPHVSVHHDFRRRSRATRWLCSVVFVAFTPIVDTVLFLTPVAPNDWGEVYLLLIHAF